ncbi:MAG: hypothetical protein JWP35_4086 [Caulobacter sp.]|nr:hypothetical protein [Caulobacter sp.]
MFPKHTGDDFLVFRPDDVDLSRSPLRGGFADETYVLGAFNPGFARLPNGNLLLMVRVAEALRRPVEDGQIRAVRWCAPGQWALDAWPVETVDARDPRKFMIGGAHRIMALTSLSWLLPVELSPDAREVVAVHYDKAIAPTTAYQQYGIEDARITLVEGTYYMTACAVSAERHSTVLYTSANGLDYELQGIILDHQNKDMLFFEGKVDGAFWALTRPLGDLYFAYPLGSEYMPGPSINLARSPDGLHWKPADTPGIRPRRNSISSRKIGGGAQPILTDAGWLVLYHGVEASGLVGVYRTFWAILDKDDPTRLLRLEDEKPLLSPSPELTEPIKHQMYLDGVVFTTGILDAGDHYLLASGEADLACRITRMPKARFA